jgi:hypothetical protein
MASKRRPASQQKLPATSLDEQERQLEEKRRKIREELAQCKDFLAKAPEIKKEQERRMREELVKKRATRVPAVSRNRSALPDNRHEYEYHATTAVERRPRLRRERAQGRLTFFLLLFALLLVLAWAYTTFASR